MANLLDQASIVLTPTAYDNGKVLCAKPSEAPYGDFDFSRNSAATRVNAQGLVENVQILSSNLVQNGDFSEEGVQEVSNGSFSQEGVQLVTNGDFATDSNWNKGSGWSISGGKATSDGTQVSASYLSQTLSGISQGKQYITEFDIDVISGSFRFNTLGNNLIVTESGHYVIYSTSVSGITLYLEAQVGFTGSIDNVSVREVGQDWDLSSSNISIGEDKLVCNNVLENNAIATQVNVIPVQKQVKVQFDIVVNSGSFRILVGSGGTTTIVTTSGTYTFYETSGTGGNLNLQARAGGFDGSITNISVKEVGQNWVLDANWSIAEDKAVSDGSINGFIRTSTNVFESGKTYKVGMTVSNMTGGLVSLPYDGSGATYINSNGNFSQIYTPDNTNLCWIYGRVGFDGDITNISVIEITDDTNLPRINYEGFSYQDVLGSEISNDVNFDNPSNWSLTGQSTISNGVAHILQDDNSNTGIVADTTIINKTYKITGVVSDYVSGSVGFSSIGSTSPREAIPSQNGEFTIYYTSTRSTPSAWNIQRIISPCNLKIDNVSVKEYLGQEVVPDSGCGSWLFEPQSTNLIEYSNDYADAYWIKATSGSGIAPVVTSNYAISPDGTQNADRIQFDATTSGSNGDRSRIRTTLSLTDTSYYTFSFYAKSTDGTDQKIGVLFDNSQIETFTITDEWQRFEATQQQFGTSSTCGLDLRSGNAFTSDILVYGIQLEEQTYATSYIPTSGSTVTRNQDVCTNGGSLASINSTEGVLYAEIAALANDGTYRSISISDSSRTNIIEIDYTNDEKLRILVKSANVVVFSVIFVLDITIYTKLAVKYKLNDFEVFINGIKEYTITNGAVPIGLSELAFDRGDGGTPFFGKTKALAVWKEALSDQELTELTTI